MLPIIAIIGPTASGKTQLALDLAKTHPIEVISLDSALIYQDMDIGTAKPSRLEQSQVPHHLIDIITPLQNYSAADFVHDAKKLIAQIHSKNKIPVIVGGTMMYFKALTEGLNDLPQADEHIRAQLQQQKAQFGLSSLYQQLKEVDPITAARLKENDSQRIERALEVFLLTNKPMSEHFAQAQKNHTPLPITTLALIPENRAQLHKKIALRFEQMLAQGFLTEVTHLREKYPTLTEHMPSMRCVGYRQAWLYLDQHIDYAQMVEQGIIATRQLAKRQLTWLRQLKSQYIVDPYSPEGLQIALNTLEQHINLSL
ncbi:tRNA (adenosine(37)-N6)-dimethylallyltransferase MiaA [Neisseria sp. Ec49-e6-T10]|uniref:tRNA (adenosine(37)-N6)-dimethylallyltransferase MiaA n=1 Tax=Neisseria sp. Ec49-e6-T10 TaxID=3140744 RepID=UPI003EBF08FE